MPNFKTKNENPRTPRQNHENHAKLIIALQNHDNIEIHIIPLQNREKHADLIIPLQN